MLRGGVAAPHARKEAGKGGVPPSSRRAAPFAVVLLVALRGGHAVAFTAARLRSDSAHAPADPRGEDDSDGGVGAVATATSSDAARVPVDDRGGACPLAP